MADTLGFLAGIGQSLTRIFGDLYQDFVITFINESRYLMFLDGLKMTVLLSALSIVFGVFLGAVTAFARRSRFRVLRAIGYLYVDIVRGTPMMIQLLIIYFVIFGSINIDKLLVGVIAFGINSGAYVSEIIRAGIQSVSHGQTEAGRSLGLSAVQTMLLVVMPQAVRNILPALCNEFIMLIKETAIVGYIAMYDLTKIGNIISGKTFVYYMPLVAVAIFYYVIIKMLTMAIARLERRLRQSDIRSQVNINPRGVV